MVHSSPYITAFEKVATVYPHKAAFKVPIFKEEPVIQGWNIISYSEFYKKLDILARYWSRILKLPPGSVIGLWMSGMPFSDILHFFGVMRAGYIPHVVNSEITDLDVIQDVFKMTGASAIIYTPQVPASVEGLYKYFPCHLATDAEQISLEDGPDEIKPNDNPMTDDEDVIVIVLTSGSTSGRPKVIHLRRKWFNINSRKRPLKEKSSDIVPRVGSFCHGAQLGSAFGESSCMVMIPWLDFSAEHIIQMYNECGLTSFVQFTPLLSNTIRYAQKNPQLLAILQSFRAINFAGAPLSEAEYEWCRNNKLGLNTALGATETGSLMVSTRQNDSIMRLINVEGGSYKMVPIDSDDTPNLEDTETQHQLLELVVLSNSLDCPDSSHCDPHDGHFHTRDLFEEVGPGEYRYRCRLDDIIKMQNARKCDARYVEDRIYTLCGGLISNCVVVGSGKPSPALIVEPNSDGIVDEREVIRQLGDTLTSINKGGYPHERISPKHILLVSPGELPRTFFKQNVIRSAAEIKFKTQIDALYV